MCGDFFLLYISAWCTLNKGCFLNYLLVSCALTILWDLCYWQKKEIIFSKDSGNREMILQATISHLPRAGQLFPWVVGPWVRRHSDSQNAPWAGAQLGLGRSCRWYQVRHLLMTAMTDLPLCPSSWWKGEGASSPVLKKRMQRDLEGRRPSHDPEVQWGF